MGKLTIGSLALDLKDATKLRAMLSETTIARKNGQNLDNYTLGYTALCKMNGHHHQQIRNITMQPLYTFYGVAQ